MTHVRNGRLENAVGEIGAQSASSRRLISHVLHHADEHRYRVSTLLVPAILSRMERVSRKAVLPGKSDLPSSFFSSGASSASRQNRH